MEVDAASRTASSGSHSTGSFSGAISPDPLDVAGTKNRPAFDFGAQEFIGGYPVVTWRSHAAAQRQLPPKYHLAKDLPHSLPDRMNALPIEYRNSDFARVVLEAVIQEAMDNEPDAPPIEIYQNNIGEETTPPWEFVYTNHMWFGEGVPPPDIKNLKSCGCIGRCDPKSKTCACAKRQYEWAKPYIADGTFPSSWQGSPFVYDNKGLLQMFGCPIFECNQFCGCDDDCPNRVIQNGRKWPVNIVRTERKGWGVFAGAKKIPKGAYIGIYAGELLTDPEGEERGKHYNAFGRTYLFTIDFHYLTLDMENPDLYENLYVVDAYHAGNFTRFVNHSCDPNCQIFASYINEADINKPLLTFFTIRDVDPWEELCFSYWGDIESKREDIEVAKARGEESATDAVYAICQCGSSNCIGRMF
ncbi:hypothetical protein F5I97DRAFT_2031415 [Phlebopus sp. FC_14]|nr:hypothetical protein F5I97DRAFT_2031415 [Phlebopus sp. FC_14]